MHSCVKPQGSTSPPSSPVFVLRCAEKYSPTHYRKGECLFYPQKPPALSNVPAMRKRLSECNNCAKAKLPPPLALNAHCAEVLYSIRSTIELVFKVKVKGRCAVSDTASFFVTMIDTVMKEVSSDY